MSDQGSVDTGNPAGVDAGAGASAPAGAGAPADWTTGLPDAARGFVQTKGWKSPADLLGSYQNLEKLMGADKAGRGVVLPKEDAAPEDWAAFYNRLGRPESPDGYKLPVPEGDAGTFVKDAAQWFHEAGLTPKQAETLAAKYAEWTGNVTGNTDAAYEQQSALDVVDLKKAWGKEYDAQTELARRAIREAGLTQEEAQMIERTLGLGKAVRVFASLGKQFAESPMRGGEGAGRGSFGQTPEAARARISALKGDKAWTQRYLGGDADARSEFERLHRIAYESAA
jgi:hypothetical protein